MPRQKTVKPTGPSPYTILMNWIKDGDPKSSYPKELENDRAISQSYILTYFLQNPRYFVLVNKLYNNFNLMKLSVPDVMKTLKIMYSSTKYSSFLKQKTKKIESKLIKPLRSKHPFLKKEECVMLSDIIEQSDVKDIVYEMFGLKDDCSVKKTKTKNKKSSKTNKVQKDSVGSSELDF